MLLTIASFGARPLKSGAPTALPTLFAALLDSLLPVLVPPPPFASIANGVWPLSNTGRGTENARAPFEIGALATRAGTASLRGRFANARLPLADNTVAALVVGANVVIGSARFIA